MLSLTPSIYTQMISYCIIFTLIFQNIFSLQQSTVSASIEERQHAGHNVAVSEGSLKKQLPRNDRADISETHTKCSL